MNLTNSEFSTLKKSEYSTEEEKSEYNDEIKYLEEKKNSTKESSLCPFVI